MKALMRAFTRLPSLCSFAVSIGACATIDTAMENNPCPVTVERASAWVNRMPGSGAPMFHVRVSIAEQSPATPAMALRKSSRSTDDELVLLIVPAEREAESGAESDLRYRKEKSSAPALSSVSLQCNGREVFRISEIKTVY